MIILLKCALILALPAFAHSSQTALLTASQASFAPVNIEAGVSNLPAGERRALAKLIEAAKLMDSLYLRQVWSGNTAMLLDLLNDSTPLGQARLRLFRTYKGPWNSQEAHKPFIPGAPPKPEQADFYPSDATKEEVEKWMAGLPEAEKAAAQGFFTVIRRGPDGRLFSVPYSVEYQNELQAAARLLKEAAGLTAQPSLKAFLEKRAAAFLSNDYYDSDAAWMELESSIEPTIGPYETYEDGWFGAKAAFEAFITVRDDAETEKLSRFGRELQWLEDSLPIEARWRNPKLGALAPIRVVNEVFASGDAARGVTTAAFNLPNDEKITREKGSKRTMLKNVQEAKFRNVLVPIAERALSKADRRAVDFDAFFTHILMHELMHGLGPREVVGQDGKRTPARQFLKETAGALEEAKADVSGLWALQKLIDKGVVDKSMEKSLYVTYMASIFRTLRFGTTGAHGRGMALQVAYFLDKGAVAAKPDGTFAVEPPRFKAAVEELAREIMTIQAQGDYDAAKGLLDRFAVIRPEVRSVIDRLTDLPVDIAPRFVAAERLLAEGAGR